MKCSVHYVLPGPPCCYVSLLSAHESTLDKFRKSEVCLQATLIIKEHAKGTLRSSNKKSRQEYKVEHRMRIIRVLISGQSEIRNFKSSGKRDTETKFCRRGLIRSGLKL